MKKNGNSRLAVKLLEEPTKVETGVQKELKKFEQKLEPRYVNFALM
jgi:hypothetical protein